MTEARAQSTPSEGSRRQSELNREHPFGQHVSHVDCCHSPSCAVRSCGAQPPFWRGICWQRASFTVLRGWSGRCIWGQHRQESTFSLQLASCMPQLHAWSCLLPRSWHRRWWPKAEALHVTNLLAQELAPPAAACGLGRFAICRPAL